MMDGRRIPVYEKGIAANERGILLCIIRAVKIIETHVAPPYVSAIKKDVYLNPRRETNKRLTACTCHSAFLFVITVWRESLQCLR